MRPQSLVLRFGDLKHEIRRKARLITAYLFIEAFGRHSVERRQLCVKQHFSTTKNDNRSRDVLDRSFDRILCIGACRLNTHRVCDLV